MLKNHEELQQWCQVQANLSVSSLQCRCQLLSRGTQKHPFFKLTTVSVLKGPHKHTGRTIFQGELGNYYIWVKTCATFTCQLLKAHGQLFDMKTCTLCTLKTNHHQFLSVWYVAGIHKKQMNHRSLLGTGGADMVKISPYPAEMDQYLQLDTVKNSMYTFTVWHTKSSTWVNEGTKERSGSPYWVAYIKWEGVRADTLWAGYTRLGFHLPNPLTQIHFVLITLSLCL